MALPIDLSGRTGMAGGNGGDADGTNTPGAGGAGTGSGATANAGGQGGTVSLGDVGGAGGYGYGAGGRGGYVDTYFAVLPELAGLGGGGGGGGAPGYDSLTSGTYSLASGLAIAGGAGGWGGQGGRFESAWVVELLTTVYGEPGAGGEGGGGGAGLLGMGFSLTSYGAIAGGDGGGGGFGYGGGNRDEFTIGRGDGSGGNGGAGGIGVEGASFDMVSFGTLSGGRGGDGGLALSDQRDNGAGGQGGAAVAGDSFHLTNDGKILGGDGGFGFGDGGNGGAGATGTGFVLTNDGTIEAGNGGAGGYGATGSNGIDIDLILYDSGTIYHGVHGDDGREGQGDGWSGRPTAKGGDGAVAVVGTGFTLTNGGSISGGDGGDGGFGGAGGRGGPGGANYVLERQPFSPFLVHDGGTGGIGGDGGPGGQGGEGGAGGGAVSGANFFLTNDGTITGGKGGAGGQGGAGGMGGIGGLGGPAYNKAAAWSRAGNGGQGGDGGRGGDGGAGGDGGTAVTGSAFTLVNHGTIAGGDGNDAGDGGAGGNGGRGGSAGDRFAWNNPVLPGDGGPGGDGGDGGRGSEEGGNGGSGVSGANFVLVNTGTISGGNSYGGRTMDGAGGAGGSHGDPRDWILDLHPLTGNAGEGAWLTDYLGDGGAGIVATGGASITNAGSILAGRTIIEWLGHSWEAHAIDFSGGGNSLTLAAGYNFLGLVVSNSGTTNGGDALLLGGSAAASFDVGDVLAGFLYSRHTYFSGFQKLGVVGGDWTVNGANNSGLGWVLSGGVLSVADVATLTGSGPTALGMIFDGGALRTTSGLVDGGAITVLAGGGTIDNSGHTNTFSGPISGNGGLAFIGAGKTILSAFGTHAGVVTVAGGLLQVDGALASSITVEAGGTLVGGGAANGVTIETGGRLAPGDGGVGTLHTGSIVFAASSVFAVELGSLSNRLDVGGSVTIAAGAKLVVSLLGSFAPSTTGAVEYVIVDNDGNDLVQGTFAGLADGEAIVLGSRAFTIDYRGGDGNDISLWLAVTMALSNDTGESSSDHVTSDATLSGQGDANTLVTLTEGAAILGTTTADNAGHWSFTPNGLADGSHAIVASQAGNKGATVSFMLDTTAPAVAAALSKDTGSSSSDRVSSDATLSGQGDANAIVTLTEGGGTLGTTTADGTGHWSFSPGGLADGAHVVVATTKDLAGNTGSATLAFTLDTSAAVSVMLSNDTGASPSDRVTSDATLRGLAEGNAIVTLTEGDTTLGRTMADGKGQWSFVPHGLAEGTHAVTVEMLDWAGNVSSTTFAFTLVRTAPTVTMALASDTGWSSNDGVSRDATLAGSADGYAVVTLREGGKVLGTTMADGTGHWSFTPSGLADGAHAVTAWVKDLAGNTASATLGFTLDTSSAVLSVKLTNDTGSSSSDSVSSDATLGGSGEANVVVTLTEGGTTLGTTTADSKGQWSFTPGGLAYGDHTIVASQIDAAGNQGSAMLSFTLDGAAPAMTVALSNDTGWSPGDRVTRDATLSGRGEASAVVTLTEGGTVLGTTTADDSGHWSFVPSGLADGAHVVEIRQADLAGNTGGAALGFTLDTAAPDMTVALSNDTGWSWIDLYTSDATLVGQGEASAVVTLTEGGKTLGVTTVDGTGHWSFALSGLTDGLHTIVASATDAAGNTGSTALGFTFYTPAPTMPVVDYMTSVSDYLTSIYEAAPYLAPLLQGIVGMIAAYAGGYANQGTPAWQGNITGVGSLPLDPYGFAHLAMGG